MEPADEASGAMLRLTRACEPREGSDGTRVLVERLWPRGLSKAALGIDAWLKDAGPSTELRSSPAAGPRPESTVGDRSQETSPRECGRSPLHRARGPLSRDQAVSRVRRADVETSCFPLPRTVGAADSRIASVSVCGREAQRSVCCNVDSGPGPRGSDSPCRPRRAVRSGCRRPRGRSDSHPHIEAGPPAGSV